MLVYTFKVHTNKSQLDYLAPLWIIENNFKILFFFPDRVTTLRDEGKLTGVIDDRGKFIYISQAELETVAKFINNRGRVSITELAENSNRLVSLNS